MWQGFTIALREGIESFLIVALTISYLKRTGRAALSRAVYAGIAVSVVACVAAGLLFSEAGKKPLWEGILALAAAALVGSLLVYMKRVSARMRSDMEHRIETRARAFSPRRAFWGVFVFTVLMIMREGLETALLVATAFFQLHSASVTIGLGLGLVAAAAIAFAWSRLGRGVDLRGLLNVSAIFLALFLVQLVLYGVHELSEAGVLPNSQTVHDATEILGPDGRVGHLLAYLLAIVPTVWLAGLWWKRRAGRAGLGETRTAA
ncbi:MAG TPA: FTR1 family protein [Thermoanaerobaculia bacterium]|jgi:high-affinity iron transporter|nr:FTR1 family protein [Thermoanaerobaculia bacterium]